MNTTLKQNITTNKTLIVNKGNIILKKKDKIKKEKKLVNVYMTEDKVSKLDEITRKVNYSRSELINIMVDFCLDNWQIEE